MNKSYPLLEIQNLLASAQNIFIMMPGAANFDQIASALALYLALLRSGKQVSVLSGDEMTVEFSHLVGVDKVVGKPQGGDLVITINTPVGNVEKVTSSDEGGKLNLVIRSKTGLPSLKKEDLIFSSTGGTADLLFLLEPRKLESFGKIYRENESLFREKPTVNISHYPKAEPLGQINVIDPQASCVSEIVVGLLSGLGLAVDEDTSTNLLLGLKNATQNFQSQTITADTFEAAAFCLRHGAGGSHLPPKESEERPPQADANQPPSPDWFEPKIYKGSTLP